MRTPTAQKGRGGEVECAVSKDKDYLSIPPLPYLFRSTSSPCLVSSSAAELGSRMAERGNNTFEPSSMSQHVNVATHEKSPPRLISRNSNDLR